MANTRKAWIDELSPEQAQHELDILGAGSWDADQIEAYWLDYSEATFSDCDDDESRLSHSWAVSENYAEGLADDHGHNDDLIEYLRAIVKVQDDAEYAALWGNV